MKVAVMCFSYLRFPWPLNLGSAKIAILHSLLSKKFILLNFGHNADISNPNPNFCHPTAQPPPSPPIAHCKSRWISFNHPVEKRTPQIDACIYHKILHINPKLSEGTVWSVLIAQCRGGLEFTSSIPSPNEFHTPLYTELVSSLHQESPELRECITGTCAMDRSTQIIIITTTVTLL